MCERDREQLQFWGKCDFFCSVGRGLQGIGKSLFGIQYGYGVDSVGSALWKGGANLFGVAQKVGGGFWSAAQNMGLGRF